jgi:hypothetical protein
MSYDKPNICKKTIEPKKKGSNNKKKFLKEIENEYRIKRCNFNPISPSPNRFIKNLEVRMRMYYKELYKSYK